MIAGFTGVGVGAGATAQPAFVNASVNAFLTPSFGILDLAGGVHPLMQPGEDP